MSKGWIGIDLDGTLAYYDYWRGPSHIGEPIAPMVKLVKHLLKEGKEVRIFTARVALEEQREACRIAIERWCLEVFDQILPVTHQKDFAMITLYDDRCIQVETNTGRLVAEECLP